MGSKIRSSQVVVDEDLDLNNHKLKNAGFQSLPSAPSSPSIGQTYFNSVNGRNYSWNGTAWKSDSETFDGYNRSTFMQDGAVIMNTNSFGGRRLYINSLDNALYAAQSRFNVIITKHLISYGGETYPKINPDYVTFYTVSGSGTSFTVNTAPSNIVVYNNDTLCVETSTPTTQYQYSYSGGALTFGSTVTGTIYVYPESTLSEYLDSPINSTLSSAIFDGSYESAVTAQVGYYLKIRIAADSDIKIAFLSKIGYPYGNLYLSYYYSETPDSASIRVYNRNYRPHGIGWKNANFGDFQNTNSSSSYIQKVRLPSAYGQTIMEIIVKSHSSHSTSVTEIDYELDRPNLATTGATVTKYSAQTLYFPFTVKAPVISDETINFDASIEPTQTGTSVVKTSTWLWQYLAQAVKWSRTQINTLIQLTASFSHRSLSGVTDLLISKRVQINPHTPAGSYNEGVRIGNSSAGYSLVALGCDPATNSGVNADGNQWHFIKFPNGDVGILRDGGSANMGLLLEKAGDLKYLGNKVTTYKQYTGSNLFTIADGDWWVNGNLSNIPNLYCGNTTGILQGTLSSRTYTVGTTEYKQQVCQLFDSVNTEPRMYIRSCLGNNTWTEWKRVLTCSDLVLKRFSLLDVKAQSFELLSSKKKHRIFIDENSPSELSFTLPHIDDVQDGEEYSAMRELELEAIYTGISLNAVDITFNSPQSQAIYFGEVFHRIYDMEGNGLIVYKLRFIFEQGWFINSEYFAK